MEIWELIDSIDILEFISQFCEPVEKQDGEFWCCSPLQAEHTPSFSINKDLQRFYDFSSGKGGNVLDFVKAYYHCGTRAGVDILKRYANISNDSVPRQKPLAATKAARYFAPKKGPPKLCECPTLPDDYMDRYENRPEKLSAWEQEGISAETLMKFQVRYDALSDRIVYPIRDLNGKIMNVGGRTLDPLWKEKNLRKYTYFKGWPNGVQVIYGLYENLEEVRKAKQIIVFEGVKSVMLADTYGIKNTGCLLTSHLNPYQMQILIKLSCPVVFALDKEVDIRADRNINTLKQFVNVSYICDQDNLIGEKDSPIDKGKEIFERLYHMWRKPLT